MATQPVSGMAELAETRTGALKHDSAPAGSRLSSQTDPGGAVLPSDIGLHRARLRAPAGCNAERCTASGGTVPCIHFARGAGSGALGSQTGPSHAAGGRNAATLNLGGGAMAQLLPLHAAPAAPSAAPAVTAPLAGPGSPSPADLTADISRVAEFCESVGDERSASVVSEDDKLPLLIFRTGAW
eukprot:CAMPEP_0176245772 /NCGR_PEP_ID=MMETSP0121_2-20121125/32110_1 /TAXON_ID=160619 /ORGANISM="Kryptoperidinium foliaceum, Strain CCMP 1326" /LENGTH=183 /DNA_ID=CAMNT_0017585403 /DNA_START=132 /DNA_END=685 /DNA_ORIENTATION=-